MTLKHLKLSINDVLGGDFPLVLLHVKEWWEYKDGKKTTNQLGYQYELIQQGGNFERFWVKILGDTPSITQDEIDSCKEAVTVQVEGSVCTPYVDQNGRLQVSVKAEDIISLV